MKENMPGWMKALIHSSMAFQQKTSIKENTETSAFFQVMMQSKQLSTKKWILLWAIPEVIQQHNLGIAAYEKPAMMLNALRDVVLGPKRFDAAFREYISRWAFKHPTPWDFFHSMENVSGEDLAGFGENGCLITGSWICLWEV